MREMLLTLDQYVDENRACPLDKLPNESLVRLSGVVWRRQALVD